MSSHREAPEISKDPSADNTDVYAFVSPDAPDTVTLIANFNPFEIPYGGPNFSEFADDVVYTINVANAGTAQADISFEFRFKTTIRNPNTFLYNTGPITSIDSPNWNRPQTFSVTRVDRGPHGRAHSTVLGLEPQGSTVQCRPTKYAQLSDHVGHPRCSGTEGRRQGLRGPAIRPVLRRPRERLRSGGPTTAQRRTPDPATRPAGDERSAGDECAHDRNPTAEEVAHRRRPHPHQSARVLVGDRRLVVDLPFPRPGLRFQHRLVPLVRWSGPDLPAG